MRLASCRRVCPCSRSHEHRHVPVPHGGGCLPAPQLLHLLFLLPARGGRSLREARQQVGAAPVPAALCLAVFRRGPGHCAGGRGVPAPRESRRLRRPCVVARGGGGSGAALIPGEGRAPERGSPGRGRIGARIPRERGCSGLAADALAHAISPLSSSASGASVVAIDNKIEQAMVSCCPRTLLRDRPPPRLGALPAAGSPLPRWRPGTRRLCLPVAAGRARWRPQRRSARGAAGGGPGGTLRGRGGPSQVPGEIGTCSLPGSQGAGVCRRVPPAAVTAGRTGPGGCSGCWFGWGLRGSVPSQGAGGGWGKDSLGEKPLRVTAGRVEATPRA